MAARARLRPNLRPDVRLLTYTNLYPSLDQPRHGIFIEERLRHIVATGKVTAEVCALRPTVSFNPARYIGTSECEQREMRGEIPVSYLSVPTMPLLTNWVDPWLWANASQGFVEDQLKGSTKELILDAHFLYPDAVGAAILSRRLGIPLVISARGSDVNVKCENNVMRKWVRWAVRQSSALITVSQALADRLSELKIDARNVAVLPNGVDGEKFSYVQSPEIRIENSSKEDTVLLSAGHLLEAKGHHIAIAALPRLKSTHLLIVGEGPEKQVLRALAAKLGVSERVHFEGLIPHEKMSDYYSRADFTVLASANEGMPNVILESLACGTRVVATDVGGVGEILTSTAAGVLMKERTTDALCSSIERLRSDSVQRAETLQFATRLGWGPTVERQIELYEQVLAA